MDLAADCLEAVGRRCRRNRHEAAFRLGEAPECRLGQADTAWSHQRIVIGDQERRQKGFRVIAEFDAAKTPKDLRSQRL